MRRPCEGAILKMGSLHCLLAMLLAVGYATTAISAGQEATQIPGQGEGGPVPAGVLQVALVDLRLDSKTYGVKNTLYMGALRPWQVLIPPGVAHGYKVIGEQPSVLVYITNRTYEPSDEGRIAYNDAGIAYDWELQHK